MIPEIAFSSQAHRGTDHGRLRPRFTILTLMVVVAISAIVMSWFRPISRAEAEKIAEAPHYQTPPTHLLTPPKTPEDPWRRSVDWTL